MSIIPPENSQRPTIRDAISAYLDSVSMARSANTARTYRNGMQLFQEMLIEHKINSQKTEIDKFPENAIIWFITFLKNYAPTSERLYLTAVTSFYEYLAAENLLQINLPRLRPANPPACTPSWTTPASISYRCNRESAGICIQIKYHARR